MTRAAGFACWRVPHSLATPSEWGDTTVRRSRSAPLETDSLGRRRDGRDDVHLAQRRKTIRAAYDIDYTTLNARTGNRLDSPAGDHGSRRQTPIPPTASVRRRPRPSS